MSNRFLLNELSKGQDGYESITPHVIIFMTCWRTAKTAKLGPDLAANLKRRLYFFQ